MNRWFQSQANSQFGTASPANQSEISVVSALEPKTSTKVGAKTRVVEFVRFLLRPFRRFTFLWCILLLVTTHAAIVWVCLVVVLFHLARDIFRILSAVLFSDPWLKRLGGSVRTTIETALAGIAVVTPDTSPTPELRSSWNQVNLWVKVVNFLKDPYLVSRWAWFLGIVFLGCIYVYIAALFSFAYYGIGSVSGVSYSWPDALVASLFIPFFVSELPKVLVLKLFGGLHCALVIAVGVGTFVNFIQRRLRSIHTAARDISDRLADQTIRDKLLILEAKLAAKPGSVSPTTDSKA